MAPRTALIVGAGSGGLAAGIALGRAGWRVRIFERAASPGALGFALNLAPNAMMALTSSTLSWLRATAIRIAPAKAMAAALMLAGRSDPHRSLRSHGSSGLPTGRSPRKALP